MVVNFICNKFGGIRQKNAQFTDKLITCADMQNVELFFTGMNSGVGIRTVKGNVGLISLPDGERVVNLFQSIQNDTNYIFVHTINSSVGKLYKYNLSSNELDTLISDLPVQTISSGVDYKQGYYDCFIFCNKEDYLYKIEMGKTTVAYQVKCEDALGNNDITGYVATDGTGTLTSGSVIYSDTYLQNKYKTLKTVYEVGYDDSIGYVETAGETDTYVEAETIIYSDTQLTQVMAEATGENYQYTGETSVDYEFEYTGYVDKEVSVLNFQDAENRDIKPDFITAFDNRIYGAIDNRLHCCVQQNILDWSGGDTEKATSAYYVEFSKNITAIVPYLGSSLAIFFKDSSLLLKGSYPELQLTEESAGGCAGYKALVFHGTDLYFYDDTKRGIYSFQQVVLGNKTLGEDVAIEINDMLDDIDRSRLEDFKAISYVADDRNEIWFLIPTTNDNYSTILIFDSLRKEWIKRKSQKIFSIEVLHNNLMSGGYKIYDEYTNDDFDGEFIENYYNCAPFNLGSNTSMKILYLRPRISVTTPYRNEFYVKYVKNFNSFKNPKIKLVKTKLKNYMIWGQGTWGVDYWAGNSTYSQVKLPNVSAFKTLNISFYTTQSSENFAIRNIEMNQIDSIQT